MHYSCWFFSLFVNNCSSTAKCVCASTIQPWNRLAFSPCKLETQGIVNSSALRCMCTVHFPSVIVIQACCFMSDYILISNAAEYAFMTLGCMYGGMSFKKNVPFGVVTRRDDPSARALKWRARVRLEMRRLPAFRLEKIPDGIDLSGLIIPKANPQWIENWTLKISRGFCPEIFR